jgi:hypothetical protein
MRYLCDILYCDEGKKVKMCYMIAENILSLYFDVYENDPQDIKQINHFLYDKGDYDKVFIVLKNVLKKFMERKQR